MNLVTKLARACAFDHCLGNVFDIEFFELNCPFGYPSRQLRVLQNLTEWVAGRDTDEMTLEVGPQLAGRRDQYQSQLFQWDVPLFCLLERLVAIIDENLHLVVFSDQDRTDCLLGDG